MFLVQIIDEQDTIEVINFMLDDASEQIGSGEGESLAFEIIGLEGDGLAARDMCIDVWDGQASFWVRDFELGERQDSGVNKVQASISNIDDGQLLQGTGLRSGDTNALGIQH